MGFLAVFLGIGLVMMSFQAFYALRQLHLLRNGVGGQTKLVDKSPTNVTINDEPQFALTFRFQPDGLGEQEFVYRTHEVERVTDDEEEAILYLPYTPSKAVLLDSLPAGARVTPAGGFDLPGSWKWGGLLFPALALGGLAWLLYCSFL